MSRFDYVKYDQNAMFKDYLEKLRSYLVENQLKSLRAKALVQTKLEEAYLWVGKAIRDDQIARKGSAELQEERTNDSL